MNPWVILAAIAAAFILILRFLSTYARRNSASSAGQNGPSLVDTLAAAEAEADSVRQRAQRDAESARRAADTEVASLRRAAQTEADAIRASAEAERLRAQSHAADLVADAQRSIDREATARAEQAGRRDAELAERGEKLNRRAAEVDGQLNRLSQLERDLQARDAELELGRQALVAAESRLQLERTRELERIAGLTTAEAKQELLTAVEATSRREAASLIRSIEAEARSEATHRARGIVVEAVQRVASEQTTETVVSVLHLPSDEMKGRIIGREGRNIRTFESVTGVNVIIDDTPEAVLLSCFDPVRREVGRITLEKLILDGRIHPHRIEEMYELAKVEVDELCLRAARDALAEVGITDLDERLVPTLGRLRYRTSYGQNVLGHLVESAHIAGVMASELGLAPALIKRAAFLHDIGKAFTHEVEGSHAIIGAELLRKYGESEAVAHAVEAHHNEVQPKTVEAVLTQAADACSASRPGARRESLEAYVKRLERIEEIATARPGVERVFAMQSGREVRVMVLPNEVDDLAAGVIAREVAKQIEDELTYPGQIRVTVVRESRATEVAH
jgi:ribonuclease Y